jgi:hypothetical protein
MNPLLLVVVLGGMDNETELQVPVPCGTEVGVFMNDCGAAIEPSGPPFQSMRGTQNH